MPQRRCLPGHVGGVLADLVQCWEEEATPRWSASVAQNLSRQEELLLFPFVDHFARDVGAFRYQDAVGDSMCSEVVEDRQGTNARNILEYNKLLESP